MSSRIHPTAIVHPSAVIEEAEVGAYAYIGPKVWIGRGTVVGEHAYIQGWTKIGENNRIYPFVVIGTPPQDAHFQGEETWVEIGSGNTIREFVTIHRASGKGKKTRVGDECYLMAYSHVAHNCRVGKGVIMANCASLGGHVEVGDYAVIGGLVGVHQFCRIGKFVMIGACSKVVMDVCPYLRADGHPLKTYGLNTVGMKRHGIPSETVRVLKEVYRIIFRSSLSLKESLEEVERRWGGHKEVKEIVRFIKESKRGIHR